MAYQQLHAGKVKLKGLTGMQHHLIDRNRVKTNPNIDLTRSNLNHAIEELTAEHLAKRVHQRIKQLNLKRKPRDDAVGIEDIIVGASCEFMLRLGIEKREQYFSDALHFFQNRYGKENVMYCQCHMDESNPHIHIGIIPITSDGRLSARDVFNPKTLEQLQTDFHREVATHYGLERGEHNSKTYLEVNQFKAQQAKAELIQYEQDLERFYFERKKFLSIFDSAKFATSGFIFTSEDRQTIQLPTENYLYLKQTAEVGLKALTTLNHLKAELKKLQHDNAINKSEEEYLLHRLHKLEKATEIYRAIPKQWRQYIDSDIETLQKYFIQYCHAVNQAIAKTYIANNGNVNKTAEVMVRHISRIGISDADNYIRQVIKDVRRQMTRDTPQEHQSPIPSWKPPKPSSTDYRQNDTNQTFNLQSSAPKFDWNAVNWELLSELDKDELRQKNILQKI